MSENLFGLTVAADPARKHGTYDPQISGADRGCGAVQDPYGSAPTDNEVFGKVIGMAKARERDCRRMKKFCGSPFFGCGKKTTIVWKKEATFPQIERT